MGYKIQYDHIGNTKKVITDCKRKVLSVLRVMLGMFVILSLGLLIHYRDMVLEFLLPGNYVTTTSALKGLISDLRSGNSVGDAITAFCKEILTDATK